MGNISEDAATNLSSIATMRRNIRKAPEDEDIPVLPNEDQLTKSEELFLMIDSGEGDLERMFISAYIYVFISVRTLVL